jgi:hypothetical protein
VKRRKILGCMARSNAIRAAGLAGEGAAAFGCATATHADAAYGVPASSSGDGHASADAGCNKATRRPTGTGPATDRTPIHQIQARDDDGCSASASSLAPTAT